MGIGTGGVADLAVIPQTLSVFGYDAAGALHGPLNGNADALTRKSPLIVGGQSTGVILALGQSMLSNSGCNASYSPANSLCHMLSVLDGGVYGGADPTIGCEGKTAGTGSVPLRIADTLITNATFARTILCNIAIGTSTIAQWAPGGGLNNVLVAAKARLDQHSYTPNFILIGVGVLDTTNATSQSAWTNSCNALIAQLRGFWPTSPILVAKETCNGPGWTIGQASAVAVRAAQAAVVNTGNFVWQGADEDTLGFNVRQVDGIHWDVAGAGGNGAALSAALWVTAIGLAHP